MFSEGKQTTRKSELGSAYEFPRYFSIVLLKGLFLQPVSHASNPTDSF